ncbi:VOC family protein [Granulicoccus sp. GXG6511]|uniref:VOC family protein n=1 Tax=Granulicoccus sp. GXG6511 TaxID=3381351 RepID=UPI003D7DF150
MTLTSLYPVLMTDDVPATAAFFTQLLGFDTTFAADWYVSLTRDGFELAVLQAGHPTIPASYPRATSTGLLVNLEVDDVDAEYATLVTERGLTPLLDIRTEDFGQRHFIVAGPDGVLIDVITPVPPTAEYAAAFG